ncbi:MAG: hypothetical protein U9R34_00610, partial [Nanoarchaeota archaeon]|nr:hypothetical protein [Nanoarchaeota archaeon]
MSESIMILKKSDIKALVCIFNGASNREQIAQSLEVSVNRLTPLLKNLESLDFITIALKNRKLIIRPSKTQHAHAFKKMLILEPGMKYEDFLYGLNFRMLSYCLYSEKPITSIAEELGISIKTVLNRSMYLRRRTLLTKKKQTLIFNKRNWSYLYDLLSFSRNYIRELDNVVWKFEDEVLFESGKKDIDAEVTGFAKYYSFKIPLYMIKIAYYLPSKNLSKEEIFLHSLLEIREETRLLDVAVVFFYKNKLKKNMLIKLAYKYDCINLLNDF